MANISAFQGVASSAPQMSSIKVNGSSNNVRVVKKYQNLRLERGAGSLLFAVEGLDFKLDSCVWEDFLDGSLGVEVHGGAEAMEASLGSSALCDPVELREFILGVGSSSESSSKRLRALDNHVALMVAPCILFLLAT
ncbi:hypothetical protein L7F22_044467 [Adiantum nelumboides]|nr:hypothetical protein [Adiantum nelumboides]